MKISKIIDELTELQQYIGNKELEACIANDTTAGVNVMYTNDDGSITSTSLEGEKAQAELKATISDQEALGKLKVKVLDLVFCEASNDPELVARADVEVTNDTSVLTINGLDLRHNDTTGEYSIVEPKSPSGMCMSRLTRIAVTNAVMAHYVHLKYTTLKSDELLDAQPERPVSFIDHTSVEMKEPTMEHSVYSKLEADKYMDWQANRIKLLEEALRLERVRFEPNKWTKAFNEMFETSIKSAVNDSLAKIETTCITALDKFCQQMDSSAYDEQ